MTCHSYYQSNGLKNISQKLFLKIAVKMHVPNKCKNTLHNKDDGIPPNKFQNIPLDGLAEQSISFALSMLRNICKASKQKWGSEKYFRYEGRIISHKHGF